MSKSAGTTMAGNSAITNMLPGSEDACGCLWMLWRPQDTLLCYSCAWAVRTVDLLIVCFYFFKCALNIAKAPVHVSKLSVLLHWVTA